LGYLTAFFNSKLFRFAFKEYFPELLGDTRELSKVFFENVRAIQINDAQNDLFSNLVDTIVNLKVKGGDYEETQNEIETQLALLYKLSDDEKYLLNRGM
jgi:hypothetical protein